MVLKLGTRHPAYQELFQQLGGMGVIGSAICASPRVHIPDVLLKSRN